MVCLDIAAPPRVVTQSHVDAELQPLPRFCVLPCIILAILFSVVNSLCRLDWPPKALALGGRFDAICKWSYLIHASIFIHFVHSSCCPSCGTAAVYDSGCDRMSGPPGAI